MAKEISIRDAYSTLGLKVGDNTDEIKKAFHKLALKLHPDKGGTKEAFQDLNNANKAALEYAEKQLNRERGQAERNQSAREAEERKVADKTDLMKAVETGKDEEVIELLKKGAEGINSKDSRGETALMYAAKKGNYKAVKALLSAGADLLIKNDKGKTAAEMIKQDRLSNMLVKQAMLDHLSNKIWEDRAKRMSAALKGDFSKVFDSKVRNDLRNQESQVINATHNSGRGR